MRPYDLMMLSECAPERVLSKDYIGERVPTRVGHGKVCSPMLDMQQTDMDS